MLETWDYQIEHQKPVDIIKELGELGPQLFVCILRTVNWVPKKKKGIGKLGPDGLMIGHVAKVVRGL